MTIATTSECSYQTMQSDAMNLANKPPLGLKKNKPKAKRGLSPISKKRAAYKSSDEGRAGKAHMTRVAALPCIICGAHPVEVHHEGKPRSDFNVLPLCTRHHSQQYGPGAYHYSPRSFYAAHGSSQELLDKVKILLNA